MPFGLNRAQQARFERIDVALAEMGGVVESQLADAVSAFERRDAALARDVIDRDRETDARERAVEQAVVDFLEARRPAPDGLRRAMTSVKIGAEMERIGDLAANIAKRTVTITALDAADKTRSAAAPVARMGRAAQGQLTAAIDALFHTDPAAARAVREGDDRVDDLYNSVFDAILELMARDPSLVSAGTQLVFAAKSFERIGDHATNIAERVHYALTGHELCEDRLKTDRTSVLGIAAE